MKVRKSSYICDKANTYTILLVCDFDQDLLLRTLDVYKFFRKPPHIIVARKGRRISTDATPSVRIEAIPFSVIGLEDVNFLTAFPAVLSYLLCAFALCVKIHRWNTRVQLVHSHHVFPQGLFGLLLARMLNVPFIVTATGQDVNVVMMRWALLRPVCLFVLRRAWAVIAVSKPLQRALRQFGISKSLYVPNSVDQSSVQVVDESAKDDSVLYVGSMTQNKRPLVLLQAFDIVAKAIPTATLHMYGDGPLTGVLSREIARRGLVGRVKGLTHVDQQTLNRIRVKTPLFVLPSATEGLSLALLEAMAAGQAVIASRIESQEAILRNGENALLFEVDDSEGLARQIMLAIRDRALRRRISRSARALLEKEFSNSVVAERLESIYLATLNKGAFS
jgi:glycosyltransferase involved in cell wall biosynthesis